MVFPRFPIIFPPRRNKNTSDLRPLLVSAGALRSKGQAQSEDEAMRWGDDGDMDLEICYNNVIHIYIYTYRHNIIYIYAYIYTYIYIECTFIRIHIYHIYTYIYIIYIYLYVIHVI